MTVAINLATGKKPKKLRRGPVFYTFILLMSVIIISFALIIYNGFQTLRLSNLNATEEDLIAQIEAQTEKRAKLLVTKQKLSEIQEIINTRRDLPGRFSVLYQETGAPFSISRIDVTAEKIVMRFESEDLSLLDKVIEANIPLFLEDQEEIKRAELTTFGIDEKRGSYYGVVSFQYEGVRANE